MVLAVRSRRRGSGARPAVLSPLLRPSAGWETPDHTSIWRFRQTIDKLGLSEALLAEGNGQLDARGLVVKRGTLVDATIIAAAVKRPPYDGGGVNPRGGPDARFTVKRKTTYFGYKAHLAVDEGLVVRQAEMVAGPPTCMTDACWPKRYIQGDEQGYFADKAYNSQAFRDTLERAKIMDGVLLYGRSNIAAIRWRPGRMGQRLGGGHSLRRRARQCDDEALVRDEPHCHSRNNCHLQFVAMAMNMKRALVLMREA